jgi:ParB/RepB/Spo0J family partition protein
LGETLIASALRTENGEQAKMLVELKTLKPNPYRDFAIDPIDDANVDALAQSIKEDGFWGGIVCRRVNGSIEIGAGHHRVRAAIKAGVKTADVFVGEIDDSAMIRVYARENATQRGNSSTAVAGTVASAVRFLAKAIMVGSATSEKIFRSAKELETARGIFESERGMGRDIVVRFLDGVPGVNDGTVQQQLANLKSSGDYARIIGEVKDEIEIEHREALKALKRAEEEQKKLQAEKEALEAKQREAEERRKEAAKAARAAKEEADRKRAEAESQRAELAKQKADAEAKLAEKRRAEAAQKMKDFDALRTMRDTANKAANKAAEREKTFDFEGVAKHFKNENQVRVFRDVVTGEGSRSLLGVAKQAALAHEIVRIATREATLKGQSVDFILSGNFIREHANSIIHTGKYAQRALNRDELRDAAERDVQLRAQHYQEEFARSARGMAAAAVKLSEHMAKNKKVVFRVSGEFRNALEMAKKAIDRLHKEI